MRFLSQFLLKKTVSKYIYQMTSVLVKSYGPQEQFTVPKIERTAQKCRLSMQYIPYAIALYRHQESNRTNKLYRINQTFLDILRREISEWFFDGYPYKTKDVIKMSKPKRSRWAPIRDWRAHATGQNSTY